MQPDRSGPSVDPSHSRLVTTAVAVVLVLYAIAAWRDWPQQATRQILAHAEEAANGEAPPDAPAQPPNAAPPPLAMVLPFAALLGAIAVFPLWPRVHHWWDKNRNKLLTSIVLATVVLAYYAVLHQGGVERHFVGHGIAEPAARGPSWEQARTVLENAVFAEFVPFMMLLFSLYTIAGGIRLEGDLRATSSVNSLFLACGSVLANLIGTTGAAMLLVRPLLESNSQRRHVKHTVVFFIFIVCNCGGCLLPIGDPPLFLGYLRGVDFFWTLSLWPEWAVVNGLLITVYFAWDRFLCYPKETPAALARDMQAVRPLRFRGVWPNGLLLMAVVASVATLDPRQELPFLGGHAWLYMREMVLLVLVALSLLLADRQVRRANRFTYGAIAEVAALFLGIFVCMQPALAILKAYGSELPLKEAWHFFWATGSLSSVLDNAPTYAVFFEAARPAHPAAVPDLPSWGVPSGLLEAISLGAVFMGANTYIGNGPNFMVKTIAEKSGIAMPSFFGYMVYSICILVPVFVLVTYLFLLA